MMKMEYCLFVSEWCEGGHALPSMRATPKGTHGHRTELKNNKKENRI